MKVWLIIDAAYLYHVQKNLGQIDLKKLKDLVSRCYGPIKKAYYITSIIEDEGFAYWLNHNGFEVIQKGQKQKNCFKCGFKYTVEKGVDVYMATLMIKGAINNEFDRLAFVNGDGDLLDSLLMVKDDFNKEVYSIGDNPTMSNEIKAKVTDFLDLGKYIDGISK